MGKKIVIMKLGDRIFCNPVITYTSLGFIKSLNKKENREELMGNMIMNY